MNLLLTAVAIALPYCSMVYSFTGFMLFSGLRAKTLNSIWRWTKWPAFLDLFVAPVWDTIQHHNHWYSSWVYIINAWIWWTLRNAGDDDPGKKLKKKLKEKVERVGGKLVVVPA